MNSTARHALESYLTHLPPTVPYLFPSNKGRVEQTLGSVPRTDATLHENRADEVNVSALR